jgi:hypothetical protein
MPRLPMELSRRIKRSILLAGKLLPVRCMSLCKRFDLEASLVIFSGPRGCRTGSLPLEGKL